MKCGLRFAGHSHPFGYTNGPLIFSFDDRYESRQRLHVKPIFTASDGCFRCIAFSPVTFRESVCDFIFSFAGHDLWQYSALADQGTRFFENNGPLSQPILGAQSSGRIYQLPDIAPGFYAGDRESHHFGIAKDLHEIIQIRLFEFPEDQSRSFANDFIRHWDTSHDQEVLLEWWFASVYTTSLTTPIDCSAQAGTASDCLTRRFPLESITAFRQASAMKIVFTRCVGAHSLASPFPAVPTETST